MDEKKVAKKWFVKTLDLIDRFEDDGIAVICRDRVFEKLWDEELKKEIQ